VRELKKSKAAATEVKAAVAELVARKQTLSDLVRKAWGMLAVGPLNPYLDFAHIFHV
jgi:hypothetical protein